MFNIETLHNLAGKAIAVIIKPSGIETIVTTEIEPTLAEFSELWNSKECRIYFETFGKLALMAKELRKEKNENNYEFQACKETMKCGYFVDWAYKKRQFNHPELLHNLIGLHTMTDLMKNSEETINSSFRNKNE